MRELATAVLQAAFFGTICAVAYAASAL